MTQSEELKVANLDVSKCTGHKALDKIRKCKLHYSGGVIAWGLDFSYQELCIIEDAIERRMIEQKRKARPPLEHPDFDWLIFKGDTKTLDKYTNNLKWTKFIKGGEDKNGHHLIFLVYDKVTVGAIKCKHSTTYIGALNYLKGQVSKAPLEHIEGLTEALECNGGILPYALFTEKFKTTPSLTILKAAKLYADNMEKDDV